MSLEFTEAELAAFRSEYAKGATDSQFDLFISECKARSLRPGVHLVFQLRKAKEYDPVTGAYGYVQKPYWITTIAALRLIAQRTGDYLGQGPEEYIYLDAEGNPTIKSEIPLPHEDPKLRPLPREPWVARATVYRKGFAQPMVGMARFEAYAATVNPKDGGAPYLNETWRKRGSEQLFKCAEALAFRKAYPEEMSGLLLAEELKEIEDEKPHAVTPASVVPLPPPVPPVNQIPALPVVAPRPNETPKAVEVSVSYEPKSVETYGVKPSAEFEQAKAAAQAAVPNLKPASEIPEPKKRGRKPKESPDNGQSTSQNPPNEGDSLHKTTDGGITDEDIASAGKPAPEFDHAANQKAAEEFVAGTDPTPTPDEKKQLIARVRSLVDKKVAKGDDIKKRILTLSNLGETADYWSAPIRFWNRALEEFEKPKELGAF